MTNKTLAFEIGTEELPAFDLHGATGRLGGLMETALDEAGIPHGPVAVYSTPRRLIVLVEDIPEQTEALVEEFRGPAVKLAYDEGGEPTQAALGFARSKGVGPEDLQRRDVDGTEYVFAVKETPALDVADLLPGLLGSIITAIPWPKSQRWGSRREQFSRPVRWILALLGDRVIPVGFAGLSAGRTTYGHRFLAPDPIEVAQAEEFIDALRSAFVVPSESEREASIREQVAAIEAQTGLQAELPAKTMEEVVNLTEYPTVMVGAFDDLFLAVPKEITVDAMLVHQRYFPLFNGDGSLSNRFLITSNGDPAFADNIIDGNQRVVAARLYDAKFFYDEDLKLPLDSYVERLGDVVFQESLGSMGDKTERVVALASHLAADAALNEADAADARRAAYLAKADLVTGAVVEFTSVQGIMGRYYAEAAGENPQVANAIADHYHPRFAGDETPASIVGKIVAVADKLDTICGLFAIGQGPTGSSDPFALRRSAIGILAIIAEGLPISLPEAIDASLAIYGDGGLAFDREAVRQEVLDFFITRTKVMLRDEGIAADTVDAILAPGIVEPMTIMVRARALEAARKEAPEVFQDLATAYARANNLRDGSLGESADPGLFGDDEKALADAIDGASEALASALAADDYEHALGLLASLRGPIDDFFGNVMVMDEDAAIRDNRLRLLNRFVGLFTDVADFGKMAKAAKG